MKLPKPNKIQAEEYLPFTRFLQKKLVKTKLSSNESALGPSPRAKKEYNKVSKNFKRYPDNYGFFLKRVLSRNFKLDPSRIILGAGSDQIFELICKLFLKKNDEVIIPKNSFIIYRIYSKINGAKVVYAKEKNYTVSVDEILSSVTKKTKIVFLANPNNPTGTYINKNNLIKLRKKLRNNILLVIDDAYSEYVNKKDYLSGLELFSKSKNVFVTRTFSKAYGLAGLRVGWGYASKEIINNINKIKPPFNVSKPALSAAAASINDKVWLKKELKHVRKWSKIFFKIFKEINIETNETTGNFLLMNFDRVKTSSNIVFKALIKSGILVRKMNNYKIKNSLRVTIGNASENKKFISVLKRLFNVW